MTNNENANPTERVGDLQLKPQVFDQTEKRLTVNISEVEYLNENKQNGYLVRQYKQLPKIYLTLKDACSAIATGICSAFGGSTRFDDISVKADCWDYLKDEVSSSETEEDWVTYERPQKIKNELDKVKE